MMKKQYYCAETQQTAILDIPTGQSVPSFIQVPDPLTVNKYFTFDLVEKES
jgi:hypothetical protein